MKPEQLRYAKTHEWVHVDADASGGKVATIGLSAFALELLTDLVFLNLPSVGQKVEKGKSLGEVESVKAVSDVYAPVDGEVVEVNAELPENLERLSDDPYGAGWIAKIRVSDESGLAELLDYDAYRRQCEAEAHD